MRMQSAIEKRRRERDAITKQKGERAISFLKSGTKRSDVLKQTGTSRATVDRLYHALYELDNKKLNALLSLEVSGRGRRTLISPQGSGMMKKRLVYAAEEGFAHSNSDVRNIMTQIASDGRCGFRIESGSLSPDTIRHWRAVDRDVTYRRSDSKDDTKLAAEIFEHVSSFSDALKTVAHANPGIFQDPRRLWILDETSVNCQYGVRTKVF